MKTRILVLIAALISLTACGTIVQTVPEPPIVQRLDVESFRSMFINAECGELVNEAFVIDEAYVFWHREGDCPDNRYEYILFGKTIDERLCSRSDSIAGPRETCANERYRSMFTTIINNLNDGRLGLGKEHSVRRISV